MALHIPTAVSGPVLEHGSQDSREHGHRLGHWDLHVPQQSHHQPQGAERRARRAGKSLTMVVSVTEPKLLMKMLHVTLTGGPGKQCEASSRCWPGRHVRCTGTRGDAASCLRCVDGHTEASPACWGHPAVYQGEPQHSRQAQQLPTLSGKAGTCRAAVRAARTLGRVLG